MKIFRGFIFLLASFALTCFAAEDIYNFKSKEDAGRFYTLTHELRCLVCQNQNLAESNAGLAVDLRLQIFQKISAGQADAEILLYLTDRYGEYILYKPPFNGATVILWLGPFVILVLVLGFLISFILKKTR